MLRFCCLCAACCGQTALLACVIGAMSKFVKIKKLPVIFNMVGRAYSRAARIPTAREYARPTRRIHFSKYLCQTSL